MTSPTHQRAVLLQQQRRYADAEREWRKAILEKPNDAGARAMLATCLVEMDRLDEATEEARNAIGIAPDDALVHYTLGYVLLKRDRPNEALVAAQEAVRLAPYDADYFALVAAIRFEQRDWVATLEWADKGLEVEPDHAWCTNLRAMALVKLGRRDDASRTIGQALEENPENALTHANQGWALLHRSEPKQAMVHFREALRLDPESEWAKAGLVEAMKARNVVYRLMLRYFLFMSRLSGKAQWAIIIGLWVGQRVLRGAADSNPLLKPFVWPILGVYLAFVLMTWLAGPLFNLLLRFDPFGKYALSAEQRSGANWVALSIGSAAAAAITALATGKHRLYFLAGALGLMTLPISATFSASSGWPRRTMAIYSAAMAVVGVAAVGLFMMSPEGAIDTDEALPGPLVGAVLLGSAYLILLAGTAWVGNALAMVRPKK